LTARHTAFAAKASGVSFTPAKEGWLFSFSRSSIIGVTSTVRNSVTCGAVNALWTTACAVALRTLLIGTRRSRGPPVTTGAGVAGPAARSTSSRVITPSADPASAARSTPSSFASLRTGGFASGT
jgi:hypothetical protein